MKIKKIYQYIAILLLVTLITQPMQIISVKASSADVTLNLMDGLITIADQVYTQKTTGGTVVKTGTVLGDGKIILTGVESSGWNITLTGTSVPTIRYKNVSTSGYITGAYSGNLNIEVEGNCTFNSTYTVYNMASLKNVTVTGIGTSYLNRVNINNLSTGITLTNLNSNNTNWKGVVVRPNGTTDVNVSNCTFNATDTNTNSISSPGRVFVKDSYINNIYVNATTALDIDNLTSREFRAGMKDVNSNVVAIIVANATCSPSTIKNSDIITGAYQMLGSVNTIKNSRLESIYSHGGGAFSFDNTILISGSTLVSSTVESGWVYQVQKNGYMKYDIYSEDSAFILKGNLTNRRRFLDHSGFIDPKNLSNELLFLNKLLIPGVTNAKVAVSIDGRDEVNLYTDSNGYLFLYLPVGQREVSATDANGIKYDLVFDAATQRETDDNSNLIGPMVPSRAPVTITYNPYANTEIEYSFDKVSWISTTTDSNCQFSVMLPEGVKRIYLRHNGKLYYADLDESGNIGDVEELKPIIVSQSPSNVPLLKGNEGSIYINVVPVIANAVLEIKWYKDGNLLNGKTSQNLVFTNPDITDEGIYTCVVTEEGIGSTTSSPITVTVLDGPTETVFAILAQSSNKTVTEDSAVELYVIPSVENDVTFQWKKNGINIPGATSSTYANLSVKEVDEGAYTCVLTKGSEVVTSNTIVLTVDPNPLSGDVNSLKDAVNTLTTQVNTLQGQLESANNSLATLQDTIDFLTGKINDLAIQITQLQNQINNLSGDVSDLQNEVNNLKVEKNTLQVDLDDANESKANLQIIINDLNIEVINKDTQITNLQNLLDASEDENENLRNQVTDLSTQVSNLTIQIETLMNQISTLTSDKDALQSQLNTANTTISNLQQQILDLTNENNDLRSQLDSALLQIIVLQGQVNSLTTQNSSLVDQVTDLEGQIIILQNLLDGAGDDTSELLQQISNLTTQVTNLTTIINQKDSHISSLNEQISNLNITIVNLQTAVSNALDSLSEYEGADLQDKINQVLAENTKLKNDISALNQEKSSLLAQIESLNNLILNLQNENSSLLQQLQDAADIINTLQSNLVIEINKSNTLQSQVDNLNIQINLLQTQLLQADNDKDTLNLQITNLQNDLTALTNQLNVSNQIIADLNVQITNLNTTITNLQTQINNALSQLSEYEGNNLLEKIQDIKNKQSVITADLNEANALNNSLNLQLDTVNTQLLSLQQQIDILTGQLNDKDAKISELLALLAEKDVIITEKNLQIGNLQNQVQTLQDTIDSISGGNDTIIALTQQVNNLTNQINILNAKVTELNGIIAGKALIISNLNSQLASKNKEIENLLKQIEELTNTGGNQEEIKKLQDEVSKLTDQLNKAHNDITDLQKQLEVLKNNPITIVVPSDPDDRDDVVDTSKPDTIIKEVSPDKVETVVVNPIISADKPEVIAQEGWELSTSLSKDAVWFETLLPVTEGYTGVYTFFDNGLNDNTGIKGVALTIGYNGVPGSGLVDTKDGFMKYTFYARKVSNVNNIYICSVDIEKEEYTTPVTKITSSIVKDPRSYTPENTYSTLADKAITLKLSADYGSYGKAAVKYQIVPEHLDFDPDGTWINVEGKTLTIPKQDTNFRVYIKFIDKNGNYTVDKTVGFKVSNEKTDTNKANTNAPVFTMYKTIYLGYDYQIQLANVTGKVTFESSDSKIAKVNKKGVITSVSKGKAVITCTIKGKKNYSYKFVVTIADGKGSPTLNLSSPNIQTTNDSPVLMMYKQVKVGASTKLDIVGLTEDTKVTYVNVDSNIANISADGVIKGLEKGSTDVLAIVTQGGQSYIYYIKVRVDDGTQDSNMWTYLTAA